LFENLKDYQIFDQTEEILISEIENQAPIPKIKISPKNPTKGVEVFFDASSSTDPDGKITKFEWQISPIFYDREKEVKEGTTTTFVFNENGEYKITLIVTDDKGLQSSTSTILKVQPFSFAIITDLHIGRGYEDYRTEGFDDNIDDGNYYLTKRLENVVDWIIENKDKIQCENSTCSIKFLVVLGDIADSAEKSEFLKAKQILDKLNNFGIPYVPVFGNHDVWPYTRKENSNSPLGENYFDQIFLSENATNTKLLKEKLNWQRDTKNQKFKNFIFEYGGINFIGLDFNSREREEKWYLGPTGAKGEAVNHPVTINWLKEKLNELGGREDVIILSHEPFAEPYSRSLKDYFIPWPQGNFSEEELKEIKFIFEKYENKFSGKQILANFGGHIHGFEKMGKEIRFFGQFSQFDLFFDANWQYPSLSTVPVLTTEALMVGGNEKDLSNKGLIRIVKAKGKGEIDFSEVEFKEPALNPSIIFEYKIIPDQIFPCVYFVSHVFTKRQTDYFEWDFGDGNQKRTFPYKTSITHCYSPLNVPQTYNVTLTAVDAETGKTESITKKVVIKEGIIPKIIKIPERIREKFDFIYADLKEKANEFGSTMKRIVRIFRKPQSPSVLVGEIEVDFEKAMKDIDFTLMKIETDQEKRKVLLYMPQWPNVVENEKLLFILK